MTTAGDEQHVTPADEATDERTLGGILRNTGPRDVPAVPGMQEVRAAVEAEWRSVVRSRQARTRRWAWPLVAGIAASAIGVFVLLNRPAANARDRRERIDRLDWHGRASRSPEVTGSRHRQAATLREREQIRTQGDARLALTLEQRPASCASDHVRRRWHSNDLAHAALDAGAVYVDSGPPPATRAPALQITTASTAA
jgi:hypothetical protein